MKQTIFRLAMTAIVMAALIQSSAVNALFMFILAGSVPGTDYVVPANIMMLGYCTIICIVLFYSTAKDVLRAIFQYHLQSSVTTHHSSPAKRRFKLS